MVTIASSGLSHPLGLKQEGRGNSSFSDPPDVPQANWPDCLRCGSARLFIMKALLIPVTLAAATCFLAGCASTETGTVTHYPGGPTGLNDQPQTSVSGVGSLMPGAYGDRSMQTGQFTGRERTNDQVGQRPDLPREADPRELARSEEGLGTGAGSLGQSGVVPDRPVTTETLMEPTARPFVPPAHVAVAPPASRTDQERVADEGVGAAPGSAEGSGSSTNAPAATKPISKSTPDR